MHYLFGWVIEKNSTCCISGPDLSNAYYLTTNAMVTSPDGGGVIIVGGRTTSGSQKTILELRAGSPWTSSVWQEVGKELNNARSAHVVIPVPESITNCQTTTMTTTTTTSTTTTTTMGMFKQLHRRKINHPSKIENLS